MYLYICGESHVCIYIYIYIYTCISVIFRSFLAQALLTNYAPWLVLLGSVPFLNRWANLCLRFGESMKAVSSFGDEECAGTLATGMS